MIREARAAIVCFEQMIDYLSVHEPERIVRSGFQRLVLAMVDLEHAIGGPVELSDPGENTVGITRLGAGATERAAAFAVQPRTGTQRWAVLDAISSSSAGLTDEEVRECLDGIRYSSECARRQELQQGGWIEDSGRTRLTRAGNAAIVWELTDEARKSASLMAT